MKTSITGCWALFFLLCSFQTVAAVNPIGWSLNQTFGPSVTAGRSSTIVYTFTNQLPWTLKKPIVIIKNGSPQTEFTYVDNCTGLKLQSYQTCTVSVTLTPLFNGEKFLQLIIAGYDHNQVPLPQVITVATGETRAGVVGTVSLGLPSSMPAGTNNNYAFMFTNNGEDTATNVVLTLNQTSGTPNFTTTCMSGATPGSLQPGAQCTVTGNYIAAPSPEPAQQTVTASLSFQNAEGNPATVSTSTLVSGSPSADIVGTLSPLYFLPDLMLQGQTYKVQFFFTNMTANTINMTPHSVSCSILSGPGTGCNFTPLPSETSCSTSLPAFPARCTITGNFTAPTATTPKTTYQLTASVSYTGLGSPATVSTQGAVVASLPTGRTITFNNQCNFPVRFSLNGGALPAPFSSSNCPSPFADPNPTTGLCYWHNWGPADNNLQLAAFGTGIDTETVTIPNPTFASQGILWSGNMSASTGCPSSGPCQYVTCGNNSPTTPCAVSQGFLQPATQAEITMLTTDVDTYDVEVINGFHIPISMQPTHPDGSAMASSNYTCGTPGNKDPAPGFGACNWQGAAPPSAGTNISGYYWVTSGGNSCNINSGIFSCTSGQLCGLDYQFNQRCGSFLGYWSADEVCSKPNLPSAVSTFFKCNQPLQPTPESPAGGFPSGSTLYQLMACTVPSGATNPLFNSCYLNYSKYSSGQIATCCGCVDWWTAGVSANSNTSSCGTQVDPQWTGNIQPQIQWMKQACPTVYTYPFDDATSKFTCSNNVPGSPNTTGYTVTFCAGNTGLPPGANNGR